MKKWLVQILAVIMIFSLVGCTSNEKSSNDDSSKEGKLRVGYVTMDITSPYFIKMIDGMKEKAKELNIELSIHDGKYEAQPQIDAMENLINQKVNAIILSANDVEALQPMVDKAREAGIKVIAANVEMKNVDAFISVDEYNYGFMGGEIAGKYIKEKLNGEANVAILTFSQIPAVLNRSKGLEEGILSQAPNAKFVAKTDANDRESGMTSTETILQANPDLNVLVGISDDAVLGGYEAMVAKGKTGENICLVGLDAVDEAIKKVGENGIYRGTVDIAPYQSGKNIIDVTKDVIENGPKKEMISFPMNAVTPENVKDFQ